MHSDDIRKAYRTLSAFLDANEFLWESNAGGMIEEALHELEGQMKSAEESELEDAIDEGRVKLRPEYELLTGRELGITTGRQI